VFDILHWMKAAFKRVQLDQLQEKDCLNKDAFRSGTFPLGFNSEYQTDLLSQTVGVICGPQPLVLLTRISDITKPLPPSQL
jgi:hypothetical protein